MESILDGKLTETNVLQFWNAYVPIVLTVDGMVTEVNLLAPLNAKLLMLTMVYVLVVQEFIWRVTVPGIIKAPVGRLEVTCRIVAVESVRVVRYSVCPLRAIAEKSSAMTLVCSSRVIASAKKDFLECIRLVNILFIFNKYMCSSCVLIYCCVSV